MQILIKTDHNIRGHGPLISHATGVVECALRQFSEYIIRVEVHLSDDNGYKSGLHDQRCMIEARLRGCQPIAVKNEAATMDQAIVGAARRLVRLIDDLLGRERDKASHELAVVPEPPVA